MNRIIGSGLSRSSMFSKHWELRRAKEKKGKGAKGAKETKRTVDSAQDDVSDAPKEIGMDRVAYFWDRFGKQPTDPKSNLSIPWKEGEEPFWLSEITEPYETILDPENQIDTKKTGYRFLLKEKRRKLLRENNERMSQGDFSVIKKQNKQIPR